MMGEEIQEKGRKFVYEMFDYLEYTGNFEGLVTSYERKNMTSQILSSGIKKDFDIRGMFKDENISIDVFIEAKRYKTLSNLYSCYRIFLKDCFSVWVNERKIKKDWRARFIFITTHPFACSNFTNIRSYEFLKKVLNGEVDLENFLDSNIERTVKDFLPNLYILFVTEGKEMLTPSIKRILKKMKYFT